MRNHPRLNGVLTGLAVTILTASFALSEIGQRLELLAFDWRMRHCNTLQPTTPIVHLDIDDGSLDRVGRWPWRRDQLADLIRAVGEMGAKCIVVDFLLSEYEQPLIDDPRYGPFSDVEPPAEILGEISDENAIFGDLELADAIRTAGNVYLATQLDLLAPGLAGSLRERLQQWWKPAGSADARAAIAALGLEDTPDERVRVQREILRLRVRHELLQDFTLTEEDIAAKLGCDAGEVAVVIAGVKSEAARELVAMLFTEGRAPTLETVLVSILGQQRDRNTPDRADVLAAYRCQLGLLAVQRFTPALDASLRGAVQRVVSVIPPYFRLADAAHGIGAVNFSPDTDGAVRRVPIVVDWRGRVVPHLGFAVACDALGLDPARMTLGDSRVLSISSVRGREPCDVPLDQQGNMIIPWTATAKEWRQGRDFPHLSAAKVWSLVEKRREIGNNETAINYKLADVIAVSKGRIKATTEGGEAGGETSAVLQADSAYRNNVNRQLRLQRSARLARLRRDQPEDKIAEWESEAAKLLEEIRLEQKTAVSAVELTCQELDELPPAELAADAELRQTADRFRGARDLITGDIAARREANRRLEEEAAGIRKELAARLENKYVFLGFAATATGDIVTTPIDPRTNGVMCHAQILNAFLQGQFITPLHPGTTLLLCAALGAVAGFITALRGPKLALLAVLVLMTAYTVLNSYVEFMRLHSWVTLAGVLVAMAVVWAAVTLFRQLTAEREKRFFAKQLSQYTSPAIASRIAESPQAAAAFKTVQTREVTCFFSDLKGFTTITEQEGAEVVQYVLNTYLERMSRAIWSKRGLINKFMGDGIMAFFNASVDPVANHQRVACEASLMALDELEKLKIEKRDHPAGRIFEKLEMRVGLASGMCMNGDMGSELKADYTVIGDVVNLAARLEPANKVFGTRLMVSGSTQAAVADQYEFRYLAELRVKGKAQTVPVHEVVCRKGALADEHREYIRRFEAGVALYRQRKWDECIVHFTRLLARRPDDVGASRYIDACQEFKVFPPEEGWDGALELKEK
ncbi:MAG TPA: CHASE2 domain-containing protein [Phycisphaerae bacterium]|nr:CHASE2 domain-containing protein [Phycisphaerae bacterium]